MDDEVKIPVDVLKKGILPSKGYKVNRKIVLAGFIPSIIIFMVLFAQYGLGDHWHVSCPETRIRCFNNFYNDCNPMNNFEVCAEPKLKELVCSEDPYLCTMPTLPGGFEAGSKPNALFDWAPLLFFLFPGLAAGLNHYKYNRGWRLKK